MAYVAQNLTDEELQRQQQQGAASTAPQLVGNGGSLGEGGTGVNGAQQVGTPSQQTAPTHSGWTNLRSYLDANRDQAPGLAGQVAGNITKQGNEAKGAIDSGVSAFNEQIAKATPSNYQDTINQASANPADFVKQPQNVEAFKSLKAGLFSGPTTFETQPGYGDLSTKADRASTINTSAGNQQQLIKDLNPKMGAGQVALNELLLNGEPTAANTLTNAAKPFAGLKDYLGNATKTADSSRDAAIGKTAEAQKAVQDQFVTPQTASLKALQDQINQRTQGASMDFNKDQAINDLRDFMGGKSSMSKDEFQMFLPEGTPTEGYDDYALSQYIEGDPQRSSSYLRNTPQWTAETQNIMNWIYGRSPTPLAQQPMLDRYKKMLPSFEVNPIQKFRDLGAVDSNPNWLEKFFPGTQTSTGALSPATITSQDEAAKMIALQNLLGTSGYFNPDELAQAGTYKPSTIGKWTGF